MIWLLLIAVLILAFSVAAALKPRKERQDEFPYSMRAALFTAAERSFLGVLDQAVGDYFRIFGMVRIADIVKPRSGLNNSKRQAALNRISAKHFDFVLCDKNDLAVAGVLELDDKSHRQRQRRERDQFVVGVCKAVSLPLIKVKAARTYSVAELRSRILEALHLQLEPAPLSNPTPKYLSTEPLIVHERTGPAAPPGPHAPTCPKCYAKMVRRHAKTGINVGNGFWGCSTYPKCRAILT